MTLQKLRINNKNCFDYIQDLIEKGYKTVKEVIEQEEKECC